jgi:hypothetical protein
LIYSDIFIEQNLSYHGSATKVARDGFSDRLQEHIRAETIDLGKEKMTAVLVGDKKMIKFVEALAQVYLSNSTFVSNYTFFV